MCCCLIGSREPEGIDWLLAGVDGVALMGCHHVVWAALMGCWPVGIPLVDHFVLG